ncbi:MAG: STAS domain-containing protein [Terriglobales bacterium]
MDVPVLKQGQYLIATVQSALTDADLAQMRRTLIGQVGKFRSRGVIVDVTAVDVLDSFACRTLRDIAHMAGFRGAETVIVGIHPELAFTMVQLGLSLEGVETALDLEEGLAFLDRQKRRALSNNPASPRAGRPVAGPPRRGKS